MAPQVDKGYAWVIAWISCVWNILIAMVFKSLGVLHIQIEELFGESAFKTSLVAFVMTTCWVLFCPVGGYLSYRWSYRRTIVIGTLLASGKEYSHIFSKLCIFL